MRGRLEQGLPPSPLFFLPQRLRHYPRPPTGQSEPPLPWPSSCPSCLGPHWPKAVPRMHQCPEPSGGASSHQVAGQRAQPLSPGGPWRCPPFTSHHPVMENHPLAPRPPYACSCRGPQTWRVYPRTGQPGVGTQKRCSLSLSLSRDSCSRGADTVPVRELKVSWSVTLAPHGT